MYLRAESHNKVAKIIFYFARAVSHAVVQTDRLSYIKSQLSPRPAINRFNLCTVLEKLTTLQEGTQKVGGKKRISGRIRKLYYQSDFRGINRLFGLLFFKT